MIVRGTTPYHTFVLPMASDSIDSVYVTYLQNGDVILEKTADDITIQDIDDEFENASVEDTDEEMEVSCELSIHLTQEDTLKFTFYPAAEKNIAVIQIRVLDTDGEAYASDPIRERIFGVLKEGVI